MTPESLAETGLPDTPEARRLALLAEAGELLSSSIEYATTLRHVARIAVPMLGDLCVVDVLEDGRLQRTATVHVRADKQALLDRLVRLHPHIEGSPTPAARALASGRTDWLEVVTPEVVASHTIDPEHARLILEVGMRSHIAVPMVARGSTVGVLSLGITESDRRYGRDDIALAEELARRAALAIDNARLYRIAQQEIGKRARVEADLRRSEQRFRALVEQSPLSTQRIAPDGHTLYVNRAWESLWGLTLEHLHDYNVLADAQLEESGIAGRLRLAFAGEAVELPEIAYDPERTLPGRSEDPSVRWVRGYAYPVRGADGRVEEVVLVHEDVTDARRAEQRLRESEARLERALAIGQMNAWDWDIVHDTVTCSANAVAFFGRRIGRIEDFASVVHPDDRAAAARAARAAIERNGSVDVEYRLCSPDGHERWMHTVGHVEPGADGQPARMLGVTRDITERHRAEDAMRLLAEAGETLGASLDYETTLNDLARVLVPRLADWYAIDLVTADGTLERVAVCHPDPERIAMARALHERYPSRRGVSQGAWHVIDTGQPDWRETIEDVHLQRVAHDDTHLALLRRLGLRSYLVVPLQARGTTIGAMTLVHAESGRQYREADVELAMDIARRAAAAVENARLHRALQQADRRKDEFLAMLAHELRNPLAPISTAAQLLQRAPDDAARVRDVAAVIGRQVGHLSELVDDLLDVSRVTRGLVDIEQVPVDLADVADAALEQSRALIESRGHTLDVAIGAAPLVVEGDRARLIQVLVNLLNNAAKYTAPGGHIELRIERDDTQARIVVRDTGIGIEPSLLPHVFDLFTQAQRTPDRAQGGLGIGLALVRSLVHLHGGEIEAESAGRDRGSTFTVRLPRAASTAMPSPAMPASAATAAPRRVLVVDDNADAADALAEVLRLDGHTVAVATTGAQALEIARAAPAFDVCILDIGLPDITGHALAAHLRALDGARRARLVALTGYGQPHDRAQSTAAGFDAHFVKPADLPTLLQVVAEA
jgi:PAS domain S-box-containing protein